MFITGKHLSRRTALRGLGAGLTLPLLEAMVPAGRAFAHTRQKGKARLVCIENFLERLKSTPDGDATLLDNTVVMYGSPMGNPNVHNHKRCPLFFAGKGAGARRGGLHLNADAGTPMANAFLSLLHGLGCDDLTSFGDSTGELNLTSVPTTVAP